MSREEEDIVEIVEHIESKVNPSINFRIYNE
jgi:hypothetical protein